FRQSFRARAMGTLTRRSFLAGALGAAAATPAAVWYARVYGPRDLEVVRHSIAIPNLAPRLEGLGGVEIPALPLLSLREVHVRAVQLVKEVAPDVVFVTGDLVDQVTAIPQLVELLQGLSPPLGIWAIPGNWGNSAGAVADLQKALPRARGRLLVNESHQL